MNQLDLSINQQTDLFENLCSAAMLWAGFDQVKKNQGAAGVDGVSIAQFEENLLPALEQLAQELKNWRYRPQPVRRVEIPKPDGQGVRLLGIPTVRDRVVQATLKCLLEPIFEPTFSEHSYGFRPGRNQQQAIESARQYVENGKGWVVDIDLSKFFDRIHHDRLISRMGKHITDKRILRLVGEILRCGIMTDGMVSPSSEGAVQGSPLSPLLSNIVLDELDKELEQRGLSFCRFADDCNIFVSSSKAAERVMTSISHFIEGKLKLVINRDKSQVAKAEQVKFLGMTIVHGYVAIARKSMQKAMDKVKTLTPRGTHKTLEQTIAEINQWYDGWVGYFKMTHYPAQLKKIEAHIRRRLRSRLIDQQKSRRNLFNKLVKRGVPKGKAGKAVFSNDKRWKLSNCHAVNTAYPVAWFIHEQGQSVHSNRELPHWLDVERWIRLT